MNLFIIAVYMPHQARIRPAHHNTMSELKQLLKQVPNSDCIVLLGDFTSNFPQASMNVPVSGLTAKRRKTQNTFWT